MSANNEAAERVAVAAEAAYMASDYGHPSFRRIAAMLLSEGMTEHEAESILKSKHARWADDSQGRGIGKGTTSAAFKRYYDRKKERGFDWLQEGREMAWETPSDLEQVGDA